MSCFRAAICLLPDFVSGLVGVGLRRAWVRSGATYVSKSFYDILGNVRFAGKNPLCRRVSPLLSWKCRMSGDACLIWTRSPFSPVACVGLGTGSC